MRATFAVVYTECQRGRVCLFLPGFRCLFLLGFKFLFLFGFRFLKDREPTREAAFGLTDFSKVDIPGWRCKSVNFWS